MVGYNANKCKISLNNYDNLCNINKLLKTKLRKLNIKYNFCCKPNIKLN